MSKRRGPGRWSAVRAVRVAALAGAFGASVLLAGACRAGSTPGFLGRSGVSGSEAKSEAPALASVHRDLDGVRSALDRDAPVQAGRLLFATLRSLEDEVASQNAPIDTEAALALEEIRLAADRWQAGAAPSRAEARRVLGSLDLEAMRLISVAAGPSGSGTR